MSEVRRYGICGFEGGVIELKDGHLVHVDDFDRVTAERDAALAELKRYQSLFNQAQKAIDRLNELHPKRMAEIGRRLTAVDQRVDVLETALAGMLEYFPEGNSDGECFSVEKAREAISSPASVKPGKSPYGLLEGIVDLKDMRP